MALNFYIKIIKNLQSGCKLCGLAQSRETLRSGDFAQRFAKCLLQLCAPQSLPTLRSVTIHNAAVSFMFDLAQSRETLRSGLTLRSGDNMVDTIRNPRGRFLS